MKTITRTIAVLNILIALSTLACDQPAFEKPAAPETGVLQVILGGESGNGSGNILRTMLPAYEVMSLYYTLTFSATGGPAQAEGLGPVSGAIAVGESSGEFSLAVGTWNLEVKGFESESASANAANALVSGSASGIVISGSGGNSVNVALTPDESKLTQNATGTLSYNVSFPGGVTGASLAVYNDSRELVSLGGGNPVNLLASGTGSVTLVSGVYYLALTVYMEGKVVARGETAHIYDGLVTPAVYSLTEADFAATGSITAFSLRNGTGAYNGRIDQTSKTIRVIVPRSTYTAGLAVNGIGWTGVLIASTPATPNFADPVSYTITLEDGQTVTYTVQVSDEVSSAADLTAFLSDMPQNTAAFPIQVKMSSEVNLPPAIGNGLANFLSAIATAGKYVDLDLSVYAMSDTEFCAGTGNRYITGLVLPDAATSIAAGSSGSGTFRSFTGLKTLSASGVKWVHNGVFYDCASLETVYLPEASIIDDSAFHYCASLETVYLPEANIIDDSAFYGCTSLTTVSLPNAVEIGDSAFYGCTSLTTVSLPKATSIGDSAFDYCKNLETVSLPKAVTIGSHAFGACTSLTTVSLPKAESIGSHAFGACTSLTTVSLPEAVSIGYGAFYYCTSLTTVSLPKVTSIGEKAFGETGSIGLTIKLGAAPPTVGGSMFQNNVSAAKKVTVWVPSDSLANYGTAWQTAFKGGNTYINLTIYSANEVSTVGGLAALLSAAPANTAVDPLQVKIGGNVNLADILSAIAYSGKYVDLYLSDYAMVGTEFSPGTGSQYITGLVLPDAATSIAAGSDGNPTFKSFTGLQTLSASGVQTVGQYAFASCASLETVSLPAATSIGGYAFRDCASLTTALLPEAASIGEYAFSICTSFSALSLPEAASIGEAAFAFCANLETVSLPKAASIGGYAFRDCASLVTVFLPEAASIGEAAFAFCANLETVSLPKAASIGAEAFSNCNSLASVDLPVATSIGDIAFNYCKNLENVNLANAASIGDYAFQGCTSLITLILPEATNIGKYAFNKCTSLENVYLLNAVSIGDGAFYGCDSLISVFLPAATSIGESAFGYTGTTGLTITLGSTAPTLGISMFNEVSAPKIVTVKVPSDATGYGSSPATANTSAVCWGNGFRGGGWTGSDFQPSGSVNSNITLNIVYQ